MTLKIVDVCVVGLGPAGLGTALAVASQQGGDGLLCVDAGPRAADRHCTILRGKSCRRVVPCHLIGGIGGAALLSGGKISDYPAGKSLGKFLNGSQLAAKKELGSALSVIRDFVPLVRPSANEMDIETEARRYREKGMAYRYYKAYRYSVEDFAAGVREMVRQLEAAGAEIRPKNRVLHLSRRQDVFELWLSNRGIKERILAKRVVLAVGRLGESLLKNLIPVFNLSLQSRPYDVGVRLEFESSLWPGLGSVHKDLKLKFGNARTFCVCSEGSLAPYRVEIEASDGKRELFLLEGCSDPRNRTGMSNLGVNVRFSGEEESVTQLLHRLVKREGGGAPLPVRQSLESFLEDSAEDPGNLTLGRKSTIEFWEEGRVLDLYPPAVRDKIQSAVKFLSTQVFRPSDYGRIAVFGPEIDLYWPRLSVGAGFMLEDVPNIFLPGDAAGHFRGILQAFCAGQLCGHWIAEASR